MWLRQYKKYDKATRLAWTIFERFYATATTPTTAQRQRLNALVLKQRCLPNKIV